MTLVATKRWHLRALRWLVHQPNLILARKWRLVEEQYSARLRKWLRWVVLCALSINVCLYFRSHRVQPHAHSKFFYGESISTFVLLICITSTASGGSAVQLIRVGFLMLSSWKNLQCGWHNNRWSICILRKIEISEIVRQKFIKQVWKIEI